MSTILFPLFDTTVLAEMIAKYQNYEMGEIILRSFPDGETYIKINSVVKNRKAIIVAGLKRPNDKLLPLIFVAKTLKDLGIKEIELIAPYLPYMRQDKQFNEGEGITSKYFAAILSNDFDKVITVDPHLHRYDSLNKIYTIPTTVLHAAGQISEWIKTHVERPLIIGPDKESKQWIADIAGKINVPYVVFKKIRKDDHTVEISVPCLDKYKEHTPVLVDDIISTGKTMIEAIKHLKYADVKPPICIGVHAIFSENSYNALLEAGAVKIITTNTIEHPSNMIDLSKIIAHAS